MNTAWLLLPALRELGYEDEAERVLGALVAAVDRSGYREYYNPLSGEGLAARPACLGRVGHDHAIAPLLLADPQREVGALDGTREGFRIAHAAQPDRHRERDHMLGGVQRLGT